MSVEVSLVLVAHRSASVAAAALAGFRDECGRLGITSETVVVDHSENPDEAARLESLGPDRLLVLPNRGYAAGLNAGVSASAGRVILAGNPDVALGEGALGALLAAIGAGWDVVGPQFVLAGFLLPPADRQSPRDELARWLASRSRIAWTRHFRGELRRWRRVWGATATVPVPALSGALLAFRRETSARVGPWDERFFLYFEETDWLRRALACGMRVGLVPTARVEHLWGHAADPARFASHFMASRARFLGDAFGWRGRLASRLRPVGTPLRPRPFPTSERQLPEGRLLWLLSPTALGVPAAGLEAEAPAFCRAVRGVAVARGRAERYVAMAVRPETGALVGLWAMEAHRD